MKGFTPIIVIALCVGAYYVYLAPSYAEIQTLSTQLSNYNDALQKTKDLASKRDTLLATYNSISPDDIARLKEIIPGNFNPSVFADYLNNLASKYGMVAEDISMAQLDTTAGQQVATSSQKYYKTMAVTFSVKGSYSQFVNFLKDMESSLDLIDVNSLSIKSDANSTNNSFFDYNVGIYTYYLN